MEPTKILHAGDYHADIRHVEYLCERAVETNCDVIVAHGDTEYYPHLRSGQLILDRLYELLDRYNISLYFLDGNHDNIIALCGAGAEWPITSQGFWRLEKRLFYIPRGLVWTWGGLRFGAMGGAVSPDKERRQMWEKRLHHYGSVPPGSHWYWWPEEVPSDAEYARLLYLNEPLDVLLTHDICSGVNIPHFKYDDKGKEHRDRLAEIVAATHPLVMIHGHLHYGHHTTFGDLLVVGLGANGAAEHSWLTFDLKNLVLQFSAWSTELKPTQGHGPKRG